MILKTLKEIFQSYFDSGLYPGLINKANRVSTGVLGSQFSTPHINIEYVSRLRRPYATSGMDKITENYEIKFLLKPAPSMFLGQNLKVTEITNQLNSFSSNFLDIFIKENKYRDGWYYAETSTDTELKAYTTGVYYITSNITIENYDN